MPLNFRFKFFGHVFPGKLVVFKFYTKFDKLSLKNCEDRNKFHKQYLLHYSFSFSTISFKISFLVNM